jgi:hypothetical protein
VSLFERFRGFSRAFRVLTAGAAIGGASAAAFVVACGSSDGGSGATDDGGATTGDGGTGTDSGDPAEQTTDGGIYMSHADAGCPVKYAGPNPGTVAVSVPRAGVTGGIPWTGPANALRVDGQYARSVVTDDEQTEILRVTGYGFNIPANVTIKGVVVQLKRQGENKIVDGNIELWLDGMVSDRPKFVASGWPTAIGTHHYGQEVDTWGNDLTPELVGRPGFGTEIWAKRREDAGTGPVPAEVESLLITIWYCE